MYRQKKDRTKTISSSIYKTTRQIYSNNLKTQLKTVMNEKKTDNDQNRT